MDKDYFKEQPILMSTQSIESKLVDLAEWTIRSVQFLGYLPVYVKNFSSKSVPQQASPSSSSYLSLVFKILSFPVLFTLTLLSSCIAWETVFYWDLKLFSKFLLIFGTTEKYAYQFFVVLTSIVGIVLRIDALWNGHRTIQFWKGNCYTLEKVQTALGYFQRNLLDEEEFQRIKKTQKLNVLINVTCICIHIAVLHFRRFISTLMDESGWSTDTNFWLGNGFWSLFVLLHVMNTTWLCFFIKLYSAGFICIAKQIESLERGDFSGVIYLSEIFRIKSPESKSLDPDRSGSLKMLETKLSQYMGAFAILEQQVHRFNNFFGWRLILEMIHCITNLVVHAFFISVWISSSKVWSSSIYLVVPFTVYAYQLYSLGSVAGEMTLSALMVSNALYESVPLQRLSPEMRLKVQMLATKIGIGPPVVTAKHFFVINRHLVTSVLSAITTFLVVLVQFKDADSETPFGPVFRRRVPVPTSLQPPSSKT